MKYVFIEENGSYDPESAFSSEKPHIASVLRKHRLGDKLPRGRKFDHYRFLESKPTAISLGKTVLDGLKSALSTLQSS